MRPFVSGAYINFIDPALGRNPGVYHGPNLRRIVAVKRSEKRLCRVSVCSQLPGASPALREGRFAGPGRRK